MRWMLQHQPPFQIICPGRAYRYEATDATHEVNFGQLEGLMVGKDITFANFKYVVEEFFRRYFPGEIKFRYRPSFFPFTEPSVEVDMWWNGRWLEMGGAGMVNPKVFEAAGYGPREFQGFAFGFGVDRLVMLKYRIPHIRKVYDGDLRFIRQF
jgi:phenylalanyl-tRNA synthetase alpha chain